MKDYLQLDGMVFKLVPIRTPMPKDASPLDMGQIDTDKMYDIVMNWYWGNSDSSHIYHDPETRRNSIQYRTNIARLMEQLIVEGKNDKAKKVIDLALEKMPVDKFGYYTALEPFAEGYYQINEKLKAEKLLDQLMTKYKENLKYYSNLRTAEQNSLSTEIITDIERYRGLLQVAKEAKDVEFYNKCKATFNTFNKTFERFRRDNE